MLHGKGINEKRRGAGGGRVESHVINLSPRFISSGRQRDPASMRGYEDVSQGPAYMKMVPEAA